MRFIVDGIDDEELPKVWSLKDDARYGEHVFPAGTEIELINNLFQRKDIERDAVVGIHRQLRNNPDLKVIKLGGMYRTIDAEGIKLIPKSG